MAKANGTAVERAFHAPQFERLNYFYGQMLGVSDFCAEQRYFREKMKLHNRCLHGYGTVCGLRILPAPHPSECPEPQPKPLVCLEPGLALDADGNELLVREGEHVCTINLWDALSAGDQQTVAKAVGTDPEAWYPEPLYVCLHYRECPLGPSRPVVADSCSGQLPNAYSRLRDSVCVSVTLTAPREDRRCETCCCEGPCACDGLLLARIDHFQRSKPVAAEHIHNEVRRRLGTYPFTTITGVNWRHGRHYAPETVRHMLHEGGLKVHFSRPVWLDPHHQRGVIDVYQIESRSTRHPNVIELRGEIIPGHHHHPMTQTLHYKIPHLEECPEGGDRIFVVVRCGFILDPCCRPVDGLNVGGRVPQIGDEYQPAGPEPTYPEGGPPCAEPPWHYGPWTSGSGAGGSTFESWFYVEDTRRAHHER
jgi:hypothetical protein